MWGNVVWLTDIRRNVVWQTAVRVNVVWQTDVWQNAVWRTVVAPCTQWRRCWQCFPVETCRVLESGQTPHFCFHDGFCRYFDTKSRLDDHYSKNPSHNIPQLELDVLRKKSLDIQQKRKKAKEEKAVKEAEASQCRSSSVASSRNGYRFHRRSNSPASRFRLATVNGFWSVGMLGKIAWSILILSVFTISKIE